MAQIFLFTGSSQYVVMQELRRWKQGFDEKHGSENRSELEAKNLSYRLLLDEIASAPFIAEKRLVVLMGIPKLEKGQIAELPDHMHPDVLLLVVDPEPDKRLSSTKELLAIATVQTYNAPSDKELLQWMESNAAFESGSAQELLSLIGDDQYRLEQEMQKLSTFCDGAISKKAIQSLVIPSAEHVSWKILDILGRGDTRAAAKYINTLIQAGENSHGLWAQLLWMISSIISVTLAVKDGETNLGAIAKKSGVPFPTVRAILPLAKKMDHATLQNIASQWAEADYQLKTGSIRATADAQEELLALIDECVLSLHK